MHLVLLRQRERYDRRHGPEALRRRRRRRLLKFVMIGAVASRLSVLIRGGGGRGSIYAVAMATPPPTPRPRVAVIGAGASGIFAAIAAATTAAATTHAGVQLEVHVLEATRRALHKVQISGGGRCNVLHDTRLPATSYLQGYPRGQRELRGIFARQFGPAQAQAWFEQHGVWLKTEADGRMFPVTDSSQTVVDALLMAAHQAGVHVHYQHKVQRIQQCDPPTGGFHIDVSTSTTTTAAATAATAPRHYHAIILATGATPLGYHQLAQQQLGHDLVQPVPSLFTLQMPAAVVRDDGMLSGLSGLSVVDAQVSMEAAATSTAPTAPAAEGAAAADTNTKTKRPKMMVQRGPILVTHQGLSGPAILKLSAFGARHLHDIQYQGELRIHWLPSIGNVETVLERLWQQTTVQPSKKQMATSCPFRRPTGDENDDNHDSAPDTAALIPRRLWARLLAHASIADTQVWSQVSKTRLRTLATLLCDTRLAFTGKATYKDEFVTAGGVDLRQVNMKDMSSKLVPKLFFCGEVLNIDGITGGYNFSNCWATGHVAGVSAARAVMMPLTVDDPEPGA